MSRAVRLELPFPPRELSPNSRVHWQRKATVVARYREDCGWIGKVYQRDIVILHDSHFPAPPVEASVTFVVPDRRKRDEQNFLAMLKPAWDGLIDAGVLVDDNHDVFKVTSCAFEVGEPCVKVVLRAVGPHGGTE